MTVSPRRIGLRLHPLDGLFFRDGRPFGEANRVESGLAFPQTLAGALRSAALLQQDGFKLADFHKNCSELTKEDIPQRSEGVEEIMRAIIEKSGADPWHLKMQIRGPWLALCGPADNGDVTSTPIPLIPTPATLCREPDDVRAPGQPSEWHRMTPLLPGELPGWRPRIDGLRPLWCHTSKSAEYPHGFVALPGIERFLNAEVPTDEDWFRPEDLYELDHRTGIGVDCETLTAADAQIYGIRLLSLKQKVQRKTVVRNGPHQGARVCIYAELILPDDAPDELPARLESQPVAFGGEGRYVRVEHVEPVAWPSVSADEGMRSVCVLTTPAIFTRDERSTWIPEHPGDKTSKLCAAATRDGIAVSGWNLVFRGPKPTRFAVPAGAVYFFEGDVSVETPSLCKSTELCAEGWGQFVVGKW